MFRPCELMHVSSVTLSMSYINLQTLRLELGAMLYKKHMMCIYKKMPGTRLSYAR